MKKTMLALGGVVILLAGCQDDKQAQAPATTPSEETQAVVVVESNQSAGTDVVTTETFVDSAHNAKNALDWNGTYTGTLPCADCSGIDVTLTLNNDGSYVLEETYQGKQDGTFKSEGHFNWDESGSVVTLEGEGSLNQYFVGENTLMMLDINGQQITGDLADFYRLKKQ
ncbi:copper resistance protein NlpE [Vibrio vulnificus]